MCYDRAHQLGSLHGTSNFIRALRKGDGTSRNYELAFHLAREAAEKGHPTACYQAGEMALKGLGTQLDYQKARNLFEKGAALGNKECIYMLGVIHLKGYGTEPDTQKSKEHFLKAMHKGHGWVEDLIENNEFSKEEAKHQKRQRKLKSGSTSKLDTLVNFENNAKAEETGQGNSMPMIGQGKPWIKRNPFRYQPNLREKNFGLPGALVNRRNSD